MLWTASAFPRQLEAVFETIGDEWGRLDFVFHSIAWAREEDLHSRLTDCSAEGFAESTRVNAISAGAVQTRAASGIEHFDKMQTESVRKAPLRRMVEACEVGGVALVLASDYTSAITGEALYADAGFHIEGLVFH